ncbi:MAG: ATP-binding protein [Pseudomonadota bacterium]
MSSIRRRLLTLLLPALLLIAAAAAGTGYVAASNRIAAFLDTQLAESARVLLLWVLAEPRTGTEANAENIDRELAELFESVGAAAGTSQDTLEAWSGSLAYRFARPGIIEARASRGGALDQPDACTSPGLAMIEAGDGRRWQVYTTWGGEPLATVCVGQPLAARRAIVLDTLLPSVAWWLLVVPLTGAVVWWGLRRGLAPLRDLAAELRARAPGDLSPLPEAPGALEVRPLLSAMNDLLARQRRLIDQERRFSAEAAHELRTPLATVRLRAEQALGAEPGEAVRRPMSAIVAETERAERVLAQLLSLAGVDAADAGGSLPTQSVALMPLLREVLADQASLGLAREVQLQLEAGEEEPGEVQVDPVLLQVLLRNLVDNALRYTPAGGRVEVDVTREDAGVRLQVRDDGPGIDAELRRRLGQPFARGERHDQTGTGLGLTIARRIAQLHKATLDFDDGRGGRGLTVSLVLPSVGKRTKRL